MAGRQRSASFALGWATALYFGQVPGRQGRILAVVSLLALAWVIVLVGFGIPILGGAMLEAGLRLQVEARAERRRASR